MAAALFLGTTACGLTESSGTGTTTATSGTSDSAAGSAAGGSTVVNVGISSNVTDISPWGPADTSRVPIVATAYQMLFTTPGVSSDELVPVLGKEAEISDDGSTATVTLYDYITDSDGHEVTADDVVFSYETCKEANNEADTAYLESVTKVDDYTVEIKLNVGDENVLKKLLTHIYVVDEEAYNASNEIPAGTSPYRNTGYTSGSSYTFEKIDNYWQTDEAENAYNQQANVDKIVFQCIPETSQMTTAMETGELQFAINMDGREASRFDEGGENEEGFAVYSQVGIFTNVLLFNETEGALTSDENLRKAIAYALNKDTIVSTVLYGAGVAAKDMASESLRGYDTSWNDEDYYTYDADKAAEYLAQSSYNGETLKLQGVSDDSSLLELMQSQLAAAGINCEIATYENALWQQLKEAGAGESEWDISIDGMGGELVTNAWGLKFNPNNMSNGRAQTGNPDMTACELWETANASQDQADLDAFHDYVTEHCDALGVYATAEKCVTIDSITDVCVNNQGCIVPGSCTYTNYTVTG